MNPLLLNEACLMLIVVGEFASTSLQVVHLFLIAFQTDVRSRHLTCAVEAAVLIHLSLALILTVGAGLIGAPVLARALSSFRGFDALWINAASAALALLAAIRFRRPDFAVDAAFMSLCTPAAITQLDAYWNLIALLDIAWLLFRGLSGISRDLVRRSEGLSELSVAETLMSMPAGLLIVDATGASTFMNEQMRNALFALDLPCDLGDQSAVWRNLSERGRSLSDEAASLGVPSRLSAPDDCLLIDLPDTTTWLFTRDLAKGRPRRERIICVDASETVRANDALRTTNRQLEAAADKLRTCLADVDRAAETSVYLRMRSRVHDVVGQRLSILHRYLEMGLTDPASVTELEHLLSSVMTDLQRNPGISAQAELDAVAHAFALVGVTVEVRGELPPGEMGATFARIVREACTNSCRHAHAKHVFVDLEQVRGAHDGTANISAATAPSPSTAIRSSDGEGACGRDDTASARLARLIITDDGEATKAPDTPLVERGGITGMRRGMDCLGGTLSIEREPRFTIRAEAPIENGHGNVGSDATSHDVVPADEFNEGDPAEGNGPKTACGTASATTPHEEGSRR